MADLGSFLKDIGKLMINHAILPPCTIIYKVSAVTLGHNNKKQSKDALLFVSRVAI